MRDHLAPPIAAHRRHDPKIPFPAILLQI